MKEVDNTFGQHLIFIMVPCGSNRGKFNYIMQNCFLVDYEFILIIE